VPVAPPGPGQTSGARNEEQTYELSLSFGELTLIYKSLHAVKTLDALAPHDFGGRLRTLLRTSQCSTIFPSSFRRKMFAPATFHVL
jgi:hypothetical protein